MFWLAVVSAWCWTPDPRAVALVTEDAEHLWGALEEGADPEVVQVEVFDRATRGLRLVGALGWCDAARLADTVSAAPAYYAALQGEVELLERRADEMHVALEGLAALLPAAKFADVYVVPACWSTGGTAARELDAVVVGVEYQGADLPLDDIVEWRRPYLRNADGFVPTVVHETVHFNQRHVRRRAETLLEIAVKEGGAAWIAHRITGRTTRAALFAWGDAHEQQVWEEFTAAMYDTDTTRWYGIGPDSGVSDRPDDLAYYVGAQIAEGLFARIPNERRAARLLLDIRRARKVLRLSEYAGGG